MQKRTLKALATISAVVTMVATFVVVAPSASAHETPGYSHEETTGTANTDWMAGLPDQLRLSELSIPGTHDTGAYRFGGDSVWTQSMDLGAQLHAGIRAWDVRLHNDDGDLKVYHGFVPQFLDFSGDVLNNAVAFLQAHPGETVLMRIRREGGPEEGFADLVQSDLDQFGPYIFNGDSDNPTLAEMRGQIVVLQNFGSDTDFGIPYGSLSIQDDYNLVTNWDLADKWRAIKAHLEAADVGGIDTTFVNFLSGSGGSFPYFVASGHSNPATGAPRLATGATRGVIDTCDESSWCIDEFPSVDCFSGTCTVAFEGTNVLTMNYINAGSVNRRIGIVMADFPGAGLIRSIIDLNPYNWPPAADAGGPYAAGEGTAISFDAAASTDRDGDVLRFRWDFDGDGTWDTDPVTSPTATHTWYDDHVGTAYVEVDDGHHTDIAATTVDVANVDPVASIDQLVDETGMQVGDGRVMLSLITLDLAGSFTDVGTLDTHTAAIDWGDGNATDVGATTGTVSSNHAYADPGQYTINLAVTDDDTGVGSTTAQVTVVDGADAMTITITDLLDRADDPDLPPAAATAIRSAVDHLRGNHDGRASNGALDKLAKGNLNSALGMVAKAIEDLERAEDAAGIDLSDAQSLLALSAKSITAEAIQTAAADATKRNEIRKVDKAMALVAEGDIHLADSDYAAAVEYYQSAVRAVHSLLH